MHHATRLRRIKRVALGLLAGLLVSASAVFAAEHPVVPGFERFYTAPDADRLAGGELLLGELNCMACHQAEGDLAARLQPKQAPRLDQIGARAQIDYLRRFIADPAHAKPGTTMPSLFANKSPSERETEVEALVQFLLADGATNPGPNQVRPGARERGEQLFHQVGCVACHGGRTKDEAPLPTSVSLAGVEDKYTLSGLASFLRDPHHIRPSGRMPNLKLNEQEAEEIAAYLLPHVPEVSGMKYSYYEGSWQELPDFSQLKPVAEGTAEEIGVALAQRKEQFGLRFEGAIELPAEGEYRFYLHSDDGSRLTINDKVIVDNDGIHGPRTKEGTARLKQGRHTFVVDYFEQGNIEQLKVEIAGPQLERQPLTNRLAAAKPKAIVDANRPKLDPALVAQGRELFITQGCASCHTRSEKGEPLAAQLTAPPLRSLRADAGCIDGHKTPGQPDYSLSPPQREALSAVVAALQGDLQPQTPQDAIHMTLTRFNCYACHQRDELGGIEPARLGHFQTTQPEMGDEGRIPPHLTGVGGKLKRSWLDKILAEGDDARPYMLTRMPKFGAENLGTLAALLEEVDRREPLPEIVIEGKTAREAGHRLVGSRGFSCISCHTFGRYKATGVQSIDMTIMAERLREDWFRSYVRNPQAFRRGTRMPQAWPEEVSLLPKVLDGKSDTQIQAIWHYLESGTKARLPEGLEVSSMMLIPRDEAIVYRNFIEGVGPRGIAVGYPEAMHLAFDADNPRLAMLWRGEFIDAQKGWSARGQGFEGPAGTHVLRFPAEASFAQLDAPNTAWPKTSAKELGYKFRGYRVAADQRPTFLYSFGKIQIEDFPNPVEHQTGVTLVRKLKVQSAQPVKQLWFRAAVAEQIKPLHEGWYQVGDRLRMRLATSATAKPVVRQSGDKTELLLPVVLDGKQLEIVQEFQW